MILGKLLNRAEPVYPCPQCPDVLASVGPMDVHEHGVRWSCGHTRPLPPLPVSHGNMHTGPTRRKAPAA